MSILKYPAWRYHKSGESKIIQGHAEEHKDWAPSTDDHQKGVVKIDPVEAAVAKFKAEEKADKEAGEKNGLLDLPEMTPEQAAAPYAPPKVKKEKPAKV